MPIDEETNVTNIGLYIASETGALHMGYLAYDEVKRRLEKTVTSLEALWKWHGLPLTHNHGLPQSGQ